VQVCTAITQSTGAVYPGPSQETNGKSNTYYSSFDMELFGQQAVSVNPFNEGLLASNPYPDAFVVSTALFRSSADDKYISPRFYVYWRAAHAEYDCSNKFVCYVNILSAHPVGVDFALKTLRDLQRGPSLKGDSLKELLEMLSRRIRLLLKRQKFSAKMSWSEN
jgi:hypothetical protein